MIEDILQEPQYGLTVDEEKTTEKNEELLSDKEYSITFSYGDNNEVKAEVEAKDGKIKPEQVTFYVVTKCESSELIKSLPNNRFEWKNKAHAIMEYPDYQADAEGKAEAITGIKEDEAVATCSFTGLELSKSGGEVQDDGTIKWKITAINNIGVSNPYLSDTLPNVLELATDTSHPVQINGTTITSNSEEGVGKYSYDNESNILRIDLKEGNEKQEITYYTTYKSGAANYEITTLENKVELAYDGVENKIYASGYVTPGASYINKAGKYNPSEHMIDWTITLYNKGLSMDNLIVTDSYNQNGMQILDIDSFNFDIKLSNGTDDTKLDVEKSGNSWNIKNNATKVGTITVTSKITTASDVNNSFEIQFKKETSDDSSVLDSISTVVITYQTKLSEEFIDDWINKDLWVNNKVTINDGKIPELSNTGGASAVTSVCSKKFVSYDYETHTAEWNIKVNEAKMALTNPVVTDKITEGDLNWTYKILKITQGQDGAELGKAESKDNLRNGYYYVEYGDNSMTVYLPDIAEETAGSEKAEFLITYQTTINDEASLEKLATNDTITVMNRAELSGAPIKTSPYSEASFSINGGQLSKSGTAMNYSSHEITWNIDVNKNNAVIDGKGKKVAVCDVLQSGLLYLEESLKVCKLTESYNGWTWTEADELASDAYEAYYNEEERKLTITFEDDSDPDSEMENCITKAYRIKFNTRVLVSGEYTNSAYFAADEGTDSKYSSANQVGGNLGGGYTSLKMPNAALLLIHGADTSGRVVNGGTFDLYKEGMSASIATLTTATTGETWLNLDGKDYNGFVSGLPYGTYILKTTDTPEGYSDTSSGTYTFTLSSENDPYTLNILYLSEDEIANMANVIFSKTAADSGAELPGAEIKLTTGSNLDLSAVGHSENSGGKDFNNNGTAITWISTDTPAELTMLPEGEYTMTETAAPEGYACAAGIDFKIESGHVYLKDESGNYTISTTNKIVMVDEVAVLVDNSEKTNPTETIPEETNPADSTQEDGTLEEDTHEEKTAVDTGDHLYPVLLLCASLMLLSVAVVIAAACRRKRKDLTE